MVGNAAHGYDLAWTHRRRLLAVLLPVSVPLLIGTFGLDLLGGRDDAAIINGAFVFGGAAGAMSLPKLALAVGAWLLAVTAGTVAAVAGLRGKEVSPLRILGLAVRQIPMLALGLCVAGGAALLALWLGFSVAGALGGPLGVVLVAVALAGVAVVAGRVLVAVPARIFGGAAGSGGIWDLTLGRVLGTAGAFLLGGVVLPLIGAVLLGKLRASRVLPAVLDVADAVFLVAVLAAQSAILAYVYLQRRDPAGLTDSSPVEDDRAGPDRAAADSAQAGSADLDAVDARLDAIAGEPSRPKRLQPWPAAAAVLVLVLVALLPTAVAAANPYQAQTMRSGGDGPPGGAMTLAWPSGQHPVIVTNVGVRYCDDDLCEKYVTRNGGPPVMDRYGTAGIAADGTVVKGALTGGQENGGPFIHYGRCTRQGGCQEAWLAARASAEEPFVWSRLAVSSAPDGALWFALAVPPPHDWEGPATIEFKMIRCPDMKCERPQRYSLGTVPGGMGTGMGRQEYGRLSIGPDGTPVASFLIGHAVHVATCAPVTCANPRVTVVGGGLADDAAWTLREAADGLVWVSNGGLHLGEQGEHIVRLVNSGFDKRSAAVATAGTGIYATTAVKAAEPFGVRLSFGPKPQYWRLMLWHCPDPPCERLRRIPLDIFEGAPGPVALAVSDDGRVLVVREGRIILLPR